jgi:hypothetical protein
MLQWGDYINMKLTHTEYGYATWIKQLRISCSELVSYSVNT